MSTVLWANRLVGTGVESQGADLLFLFRHKRRLDRIARELDHDAFSSLWDDTDLRVNLDQLALPEGMQSTDELMARDGRWVDASAAVALLAALTAHVRGARPKFGLIRNDCDGVLEDLEEALTYARAAAELDARFNLAIVL
ncbi:MAG: hypothetical protein AAGE01_02720 [Pseudomonadota bacterium]